MSRTTSLAICCTTVVLLLTSCTESPDPTGPGATPQPGIVVPPSVPPGPPSDAGKPGSVTIVQGGGSMPAGSTMDFKAQVVDKKDAPLAGRPVTWSSTSDGSFSPTDGVTDAGGYVTTSFTATTAGTYVVTATSGVRSASVEVTVVGGPATHIAMYSGDGGTEVANGIRTVAVIVTDQYGNPVSGHTVTWLTNYGHVTGGQTTNSEGVANASWQVETKAGEINILQALATNSDDAPLVGSPVDFHVLIVPGPATRIEVQPMRPDIDGEAGLRVQFTAHVFDPFDNEITDANVEWTSSDPSLVTIDSSGLATVVTNNCAGTQFVDITATSGFVEGRAVLILNPINCD